MICETAKLMPTNKKVGAFEGYPIGTAGYFQTVVRREDQPQS